MNVGIDIKDIPKIDDNDYSVTLNAFFVVRWKDERLVIDQEKYSKTGQPTLILTLGFQVMCHSLKTSGFLMQISQIIKKT